MEFKFWFYVGLGLIMILMGVAGGAAQVCSDLVFWLTYVLGVGAAICLIAYVFRVVNDLNGEIYRLSDQVRDLQKDK